MRLPLYYICRICCYEWRVGALRHCVAIIHQPLGKLPGEDLVTLSEPPLHLRGALGSMRIICFSTHSYDRDSFERFNREGLFAHEIVFLEPKLNSQTVNAAVISSYLTSSRSSLLLALRLCASS